MVAATVFTLVAFLACAPSVRASGGPKQQQRPLTPFEIARLIRANASYLNAYGNYVGAQASYVGAQASYVGAYGNYLNGVSNVITATGRYHNQIQEARITRERSRQMVLDTQRKTIEFLMWYDTVRPTAPKLLLAEETANLDLARNHALKTDIWSGRALNVLLGSIVKSSTTSLGPNVPLNETVLRGINLTDGSTRANLAMTKNEGKIDWPEALQDKSFDEVRNRFSKNFEVAVFQVSDSGPPSRPQLKDLRADLKSLEEQLETQVHDLTPSRYIESRRLLKQLNDTVRGLSSAKLVRSPHADWRRNVKTVSDLVAYCQQNGLEFGPAVDGDKAAYTAAYTALRNYERGVVQSTSLN